MHGVNSIYLAIRGLNPIYLGKFDETEELYAVLNYFQHALGVNVEVLGSESYSEKVRMRANPATQSSKYKPFNQLNRLEKQKLLGEALDAPNHAFNFALLNRDICTVGQPREIQYPIRVSDVEDVSVELAGIHLAMLVPNLARALPKTITDKFEHASYITQEEIDRLDDKQKTKVKQVVFNYCKGLLRTNTKLSKNKVPSSLGIGKPSDVEGFNEVATLGSVGLSFLPAKNFFIDDPVETKQRSFKSIVKEYAEALNILASGTPAISPNAHKLAKMYKAFEKGKHVETKKGAQPLSAQNLKILEYTFNLLSEVFDTPSLIHSKKTACLYSSRQCRSTCLVSSGRRGNDAYDVFDFKRTLDEGHTRMLLGYYQAGFLANPYYFLRILIEAIYQHVRLSHQKVCEYNAEAFGEGREDDVIQNVEEYFEKLPPSVRLNVYSDYPWERIFPDLFNLFARNEHERIGFGNYPSVGVQFYDYTKIPGRWSTETRKRLCQELDSPWRHGKSYVVPSNYDLTFSFSGTPKSYQYQEICLKAGQFATVVFSSASLASKDIIDAFKMTSNTFKEMTGEEVYNKKIAPILSKIQDALMDNFGNGNVKPLDLTSRQIASRIEYRDRIPKSFDGYRVISGDMYDLRFLDKYMQINNEPLIIGLTWKIPKNIPISINNQTYDLEPTFCAILLNESETAPKAKRAKAAYMEQRERVSQGVGFAVNMLSLGSSVEVTEDFVSSCFTIFVTAESPEQESTLNLIEKLADVDVDKLRIDAVTFNTETGATMNMTDGVQNFHFELDRLVTEPFEKLKESK